MSFEQWKVHLSPSRKQMPPMRSTLRFSACAVLLVMMRTICVAEARRLPPWLDELTGYKPIEHDAVVMKVTRDTVPPRLVIIWVFNDFAYHSCAVGFSTSRVERRFVPG